MLILKRPVEVTEGTFERKNERKSEKTGFGLL